MFIGFNLVIIVLIIELFIYLLFWRDLTGELKKWGFELNPYDTCVANKTINNKQCTILWHVNDLKISHVEEAVVKDMISRLNEKC